MITKNINKILMAGLMSCLVGATTTSCSDMLEPDSSRQLFDPALNQKTDSVTYAYGVMQAMQQLADQYYFQNEMRGDLVKPTAKASTHLQALSSFTADASNKYDSVYLYYKVINNCNFYLAHRDTTLKTGSQNVVINEYAGIASIRAWTYLQLARQYGAVPYVTEPVTSIAQINANTSMTDFRTILTSEARKLESLKAKYSEDQLSVPTFNQTSRSVGVLNWDNTTQKYIAPSHCFIPLNVVLGDLYLELGEYEKAATCYYQYLRYKGMQSPSSISVYNTNYFTLRSSGTDYRTNDVFLNPNHPVLKYNELPLDYNEAENGKLIPSGTPSWMNSFTHASNPGEVISYIPMAVNYTMGKTTDIPAAFGYNYYGTERKSTIQVNGGTTIFNCPKTDQIQVVPSQAYVDSARNAQFYYYAEQIPATTTTAAYWTFNQAPFGDSRAFPIQQGVGADSMCVYVQKPATGYILLYRNTTVWLHLAEAINRMGYPDVAFAVLKNGIQSDLLTFLHGPLKSKVNKDEDGNLLDSLDANGNVVMKDSVKYYITPKSYSLLTTTLPFLSAENIANIFKNTVNQNCFVGIHYRGAGAVADINSPYNYWKIVDAKIADLNTKFALGLNTADPKSYTLEDRINAVEDLLCDEYAMEFAFEGTRFSDLRRIALHKNQAGTYGGNFGDKWLSHMLQNNASGITTQNCYLPYK